MAGYQFLLASGGILAGAILSFVAGYFIARSLRMPDHGWKIGLVLCAVVVGGLLTWAGWPPRLGIDLSGGVTLIYEIDTEQQEVARALDNTTMGKLAGAISRRVDPKGLEEITIRPYGENQIQIVVPNADEADVRRIETKVSRQGTLEFRILANRLDHENLIERAQRMPLTARRLTETIDGNEVERARWVPLGEHAVQYADDPNFATRVGARKEQEILVVVDAYNITGDLLSNARPTFDQRGRDAVGFEFNAIGAQKFTRLTSENMPTETGGTTFYRYLAIIIDGYLYTAPRLQSVISGSGIIEGEFTKEQVEEDVAVLNAGSLPAVLKKEPSSRTYIGPTLGQDTIRRASYAMVFALLGTFVFMSIYYRFAGLVATLAMMMNLLLLMAMMITLKAALTLPGLAGIALTVGMAVDANVLIYERMREELARGTSLRMAIRNGFERAMSAIVDSNVTTIITSVVLYAIGTDQVKGFALTLTLGILISMFTAIFCARVVFDVAEKTRWITRLRMMQLLENANIDFMGKGRIATAVSALVILIGLGAVVARGANLLDIDFTGGTEVELLFDEPQTIADVRQNAERALPDVTVSDIKPYQGEQAGRRFKISTSNQNVQEVEDKLVETFGQKLQTGSLAFKQVPVPASETEQPASPASGGPAFTLPPASSSTPGQQPPTANPPASPAPAEGQPPATTPAPPSETPPPDKQGSLINPSAEGLLALADFQQPAPGDDAPATAPTTRAADTTSADQPSSATATSATPPAATERTRFELDFAPERISYDVLKEDLDALLQRLGKQASYTLSNPDYVEGSGDAFSTWTLDITLPEADAAQVVGQLEQERERTPVFPASSKIGGRVAADTQMQAIYALLASLVFMLAYIWLRFEKVIFGVAAVVALVHDVLVTLGFVALSFWLAKVFGFLMIDPFKVNLTIVAAFLTIVGYSINAKIVVFDRHVHHGRRRHPRFCLHTLRRADRGDLQFDLHRVAGFALAGPAYSIPRPPRRSLRPPRRGLTVAAITLCGDEPSARCAPAPMWRRPTVSPFPDALCEPAHRCRRTYQGDDYSFTWIAHLNEGRELSGAGRANLSGDGGLLQGQLTITGSPEPLPFEWRIVGRNIYTRKHY
ncbi:MAG: protein translocase subunit SecD [Planctomycetes bacterium]|nr:protein translocase subunit SecD [Planctomycetota bacterium]